MRLVFDRLEITGFRSFLETQTVVLSGEGVTFLQGVNEAEPDLGPNGAGKSSIWSALCWCLYGRTPEGLRNPDVKPWNAKITPEVRVYLSVDDKDHVIVRKAVTNGVTIDGEAAGPEEPANLVQLSYETFTNAILYAQGKQLFFDYAPKAKLALLAEVLQLERWEERSTAAGKHARELEDLEREMTGELAGLTTALERAAESLERGKAQSQEWLAARKERLQELSRLIEAEEAQLPALRDRYDTARLALDGAGTELKALRDAARKAVGNEAEAKAVTLAGAVLRSLQAAVANTEREIVRFNESPVCSECGQPIKLKDTQKHKNELLKRLQLDGEKLDEATIALRRAEAAYAKVKAGQQNDLDAIADFEDKVDEFQRTVNVAGPLFHALEANLAAHRRERNTEVSNPYTDIVHAAKRTHDRLGADIQHLEADLRTARAKSERTRFWVKGFRDIQLYLLDEALQELEIATNVLLEQVGLYGWRVVYAVEKETKSGTIQSGLTTVIYSPTNKDPVRWEVWSGGEGQRLRLVGALALGEVLLNRAGVEPNLEVLDEPTKHLSREGVEDLCLYLEDRARASGKAIWLVDHTTRRGQTFSRTVTVTKGVKGSRIS